MTITQNVTLPTIHMNGSSKQDLFDQYYNAYQKVKEAIEALQKVEFNARDYYVQGNEAFPNARKERDESFSSLVKVQTQLEEIVIHLS